MAQSVKLRFCRSKSNVDLPRSVSLPAHPVGGLFYLGRLCEWLKPPDCKSGAESLAGSNPALPTN